MNTDIAVFSNNNTAGTGVIIRNANGEFKTALEPNIGVASNVTAELWAIRDGLMLAKDKDIRSIQIETDSKIVFDMLAGTKRSI